jgi:thiol-disulfide isomerase/thioredoxin
LKIEDYCSLLIVSLSFVLIPFGTPSLARVLEPGDTFPLIYLDQPSTPEENAYLGLSDELTPARKKQKITIADINAELIVVEFMNRYCPSCQAQVPIMNRASALIERKPDLKNKVRLIGIGAGNNDEELKGFSTEQEIPFPLFQDSEFIAYDAIGDPEGTPFTILVRRINNRFVVLSTHLGRISSAEDLVNEIQDALMVAPQAVHALAKEKALPRADSRVLTLTLTEKDILQKARQSMQASFKPDKKATRITITKIKLPGSGTVFRGVRIDNGKDEAVYAKLISRNPTCDICHGIHFIVTFDRKGIIKDFFPVHLTKYGNVNWSAADVELMKNKIVGRSLQQHKAFNPKVDAVSMATMSSALIYNSLNKLQFTVSELQRLEK